MKEKTEGDKKKCIGKSHRKKGNRGQCRERRKKRKTCKDN